MENLLRRGQIFFAVLAALVAIVLLGSLLFPTIHEAWLLSGLATAAISFLFGMLVFLTLITALLGEGKSLEEIQEDVARLISRNDRVRSSAEEGAAFLAFVQILLMLFVAINGFMGSKSVGAMHFVLLVTVTVTGILGAFAICFSWLFSFCMREKVEEDVAETSAEQDIETVPESPETVSSCTALVPVEVGLPVLSKQ